MDEQDTGAPVDAAPETVAKPEPAEAAQPPDETDWKAKFEELQGNSRKWESRAKENADAAKRLKEIEDRDLSELDKAKRAASEASTELESLRRQTLVQQVAIEKQLPPALASRLQGATAEELAADADSLLALLKKAPKPDPGQGNQVLTEQERFDAEYKKFYPN